MNIILIFAFSFLPFLEARNAQAVSAVDPKNAVAVTDAAGRPDLRIRDTCGVCDGKGKLIVSEPDFGQSTGRIGVGSRRKKLACPICRGNGRFECLANPTDLAAQVVRDRDAFAAAHLAKGEVAVGPAFVSPALAAELQKDSRRRKMLIDAFGQECPACHWCGFEPCRKCHGVGVIPCTVSDCKHGWLVTKTEKKFQSSRSGGNSFGNGGYRRSGGSRHSSRTETKITVTECALCGGVGKIRCPDCNGRRAAVCRKCNGTGEKRRTSY